MIAGLLLAAGAGTRFGGDKLLAPLAGETVLRRSARTLAAGVDTLVVVVPPDAAARISEVRSLGARVIEHAGWRGGMASSLAAGVAALDERVEAVVVALGDQPLVRPDVIRALVERWRAGRPAGVAPEYRNGQGNPVLFGRGTFAELLRLEGDAGARRVLAQLPGIAMVPVDDDIPIDVDTPEAFRALEAQLRRDS